MSNYTIQRGVESESTAISMKDFVRMCFERAGTFTRARLSWSEVYSSYMYKLDGQLSSIATGFPLLFIGTLGANQSVNRVAMAMAMANIYIFLHNYKAVWTDTVRDSMQRTQYLCYQDHKAPL